MKKINFSKNLRKKRREEDLTQAELGEYIGVRGSAISAYEKGDVLPSVDKIVKIADVFDVTVDDLIF